MKKSLVILTVLCGLSLATAGAAESSASSVFAGNGSFTITFELPASLDANGGTLDLNVGFGEGSGGGVGTKATFAFVNGVHPFGSWLGLPDQHAAYYSLNGNLTDSSAMGTLTETITPSIFKLEVTDGFSKSSFSYLDANGDYVKFVTTSGNDYALIKGNVSKLEEMTITHKGGIVTLGTDQEVRLQKLKVVDEGAIKTPSHLTLTEGDSMVDNLEVNGVLTLGSKTTAATLTAGGTLNATGGIMFCNASSTASADKLEVTTLNVVLTNDFIAGMQGGEAKLLALNEAYTGTITLNTEITGSLTMNGIDDTLDIRSMDNKSIYTLSWEKQLARAATNQWYLVLSSRVNSMYVREKLDGVVCSHNGYAGLSLLSNAFVESNPQINDPQGALAALMNAVDAGAMTDTGLAATAGSSVTVLGQALGGDAERQLRAIRNRAVTGIEGSDTIVVKSIDAKGTKISTTTTKAHKFSVWVNGEGNRTEQDADGTAAGYILSSWGGTVGAGMQLNQQLTLGVALTAMRGDVKSEGADHLDGDMDTTYLSAFAHYQSGAWSHSFIGTAGAMDSDYMRTVSFAADSYTASGDTEGSVLGLMYELSREFALSGKKRISPVFNISYRHTEVDGYSEGNSDAALRVGEQSLDTVTMGLGARYAAMVGEQTINRACALEARALVKYDVGDLQSDTMVGIAGQAARANVESAELGAFGVELGAGISVPTGPGSVFADGAVELRDDYVNFNAAVGYKIQF